MNLLFTLTNPMMTRPMRIQLIFLLILLGAVSSAVSLHAQAVTGGPGQPEFTSFEPYADGYRVNPLTGGFTYQIPAVYVPGPNGGYDSIHSAMYNSLNVTIPEKLTGGIPTSLTRFRGATNSDEESLLTSFASIACKCH